MGRASFVAGLIAFGLVDAVRAEDEDSAAHSREVQTARDLEALGSVLARAADADMDVRRRARHEAREIALRVMRARAPKGMRLIPGRLVVGARGVRSEGGFYVGVTEVTVGEFLRYWKALDPKSRRRGPPLAGDPAIPVTKVTLQEARAYATAQGSRIPTLAELRRVMTADGRFRYPWGDARDTRRANLPDSGVGAPEPVGKRPDGASAEGVLNLAGNVAEWTTTAKGEGERRRFYVAGGSFKRLARAKGYYSYLKRAVARSDDVGIRLVRDVDPVVPPRSTQETPDENPRESRSDADSDR